MFLKIFDQRSSIVLPFSVCRISGVVTYSTKSQGQLDICVAFVYLTLLGKNQLNQRDKELKMSDAILLLHL